jgi:DNA-binding NarL/FixJ family response regulator
VDSTDAVLRELARLGGAPIVDGPPWLGAIVAFWGADARCGALAAEALDRAAVASELALARAADGFAAALTLAPRDDSLLAAAVRPPEEPLAAYLLAEAALDCGRLDLAEQFWRPLPEALFGDPRHPFLTLMRVSRVRSLAFQGRIDEARPLATAAVAAAPDDATRLLARCASGLVDGNAADRRGARAIADDLETSGIRAIDYPSRGCYLLAAYGLVAVGDLERAARFALIAGGSADLDALTVIDRALALELLVALAVADGDLDAASAWAERALPVRENASARATIARLDARVALLAGEAARAVELAEHSETLARADGRVVEAAEAGIVLARARIAARQRGAASEGLATMVASADDRGHHAARRAAARELRAVGRRLKPGADTGWDGLSAREREVAELIVRGMSNREIGDTLYVSPHTVRIHVSRVLAAFGVATRGGVAARLAVSFETAGPPAPLTARQQQVVDLLVAGLGNRDIAERLGIGERGVEKHVSEVRRRWAAGSRTAVVAVAVAWPRVSGADPSPVAVATTPPAE